MRGKSRTLAVVATLALAGAALGAQSVAGKPLPEATMLNAVDGKLLHMDANDTWWFELTGEVKSETFRLAEGTRFLLLPSAILEQLIADVNDRFVPTYRLTARVTRYQGANFLLATYFLPLSKFKSDKPEPAAARRQTAGDGLPVDPALAVPPEILEKLRTGRPVRGPLRKPVDCRAGPPADVSRGRMLANRVGLIEAEEVEAWKRGSVEASDQRVYACTQPRYCFTPYALGWSVSSVQYELLPCAVLEQAQQLQRSSMETVRFNVAGLVTQFKGRQYLLLQRAAPVYNYGNFGR